MLTEKQIKAKADKLHKKTIPLYRRSYRIQAQIGLIEDMIDNLLKQQTYLRAKRMGTLRKY